MKDILKAMRTQKLWKFDVYKKGTSMAFWLILESCEILIVSNKLDLDCQMLTDEELADKAQDDLLANGYKPIELNQQVINKMEKMKKQMLAKALGF